MVLVGCNTLDFLKFSGLTGWTNDERILTS